MLVVARKKTGAEMGPSDHGHVYSPRSVFPVTLGQQYTVFAMNLYDHHLAYLVYNDVLRPDWMPIGLFEVLDPNLPSDWQFRAAQEANLPPGKWGLQGLWGYPELVESQEHYEGLIELNERDVMTFLEVRSSYGRSVSPEIK
jgi:hypothetical protein